MKVAFVVDASVVQTKRVHNNDNIYVAPFLAYNESGTLSKIYDKKIIDRIQKENADIKSYVDPTPGMYRDLYNEILQDGYDYIVVVPQSKSDSKSYLNADYVQRISFDEVMVVDVTEYNLKASDVFNHIIKENRDNELSGLTFDLQAIIDYIKNYLNKLSILMA